MARGRVAGLLIPKSTYTIVTTLIITLIKSTIARGIVAGFKRTISKYFHHPQTLQDFHHHRYHHNYNGESKNGWSLEKNIQDFHHH